MNCRTVFPRLVLSLALLWAAGAAAATRTVTTNADSGVGSLRQAIADSTSGDTILFALGSGNETITIGAELAISGKSLTIYGANTVAGGGSGTAVTITVPVPGTSTTGTPSPYRVFTLALGTGNMVDLSYLTLKGGFVVEGGVIYCVSGTTVLTEVTLTQGKAASAGGGLFVDSDATARLMRVMVRGNSAGGYGGGLFVLGGGGGTATLTQTTVSGNSANYGGGLCVYASTATLTQTTVSGNSASGYGGGLLVTASSTATLMQTTVSGNSANSPGGGVCVFGSKAMLTQTTVSGNSADLGGGLYLDGGGRATLLDTIVIDNAAASNGGDLNNNGLLSAYASWYASTSGTITTAAAAPNVTTAYAAGALGALADNGGATQTLALARTAPAVGMGVLCYRNATDGLYFKGTDDLYYKVAADGTLSSFTPSDSQLITDRLATDQRGVGRNAPIDLGAFQLVRVATATVPASGTYKAGATLSFTVSFNDTVTVSTTGGTPSLALTLGSTAREANYVSGSGSANLVFTYTVQAGDTDTDGIAVGAVSLGGGTISDRVGSAADLTLPAVDASSITIDTTAPAAPVVAAAGADSIVGYAEPGSTVTVYIDGNLVGTAVADATTGLWTLTLATPLTAGATHSFTASATDTAGNSGSTGSPCSYMIGSGGKMWAVTVATDTATVPVGGSLRFALLHAGSGDTILFSLPSGSETITLAAALPPITGDLTIDGGTLGDVILDGAGAYRVFFVDSGTVALKNLWIRNALAQGGAGGSGDGGGGGGAGLGAGLFVNQATADVTVSNVSFISMRAVGGAGGAFLSQSYAGGGGGGMGFRGGNSTANTGAPGGGGMLAPGTDLSSGNDGSAGGAGGGGGGGQHGGAVGAGGTAYAGNDAGSAGVITSGGAGGFGGGGGGAPLGVGGAGGFGGGGGGTGTGTMGGAGGPGGGGGGSDGNAVAALGGSLGSGVSGGQSGAGVGSGGGGGAAAGPAIFVRLGSLTTVSCAWDTATATGGAGGVGRSAHDGTAGTADSTPTFNYGGTVNGSTATGPIPSALIACTPVLTSVTLVSSNATPTLAKSGDTVTLSFTANRAIDAPTVTLAGHVVTATNTSGNVWSANFTVGATDAEGAVAFSIGFTSTDGFAGTAVTSTTDSSAVTIDRTAPETTITSQPASQSASASATFTFSSADASASFEARLDSVAYAPATSPLNFTGLAEGAHTFAVRALDAAGNADATPASYTWTVDTTAPSAPTITSPTSTADTTPTLTGTAESGATVSLSVDGVVAGSTTSNGTWSLTLPIQPLGAHTIAVTVTDAAGNTATTTFTLRIVETNFAAPVPDGYGASATGGSAGTTVLVSTAEEFATYATSSSAQVITVAGTLDIGTVAVASNKTIQGADASATLDGCLSLSNVSNIVIRGLNLANPDGTALRLAGASKVYVTRCSFLDAAAPQLVATGSDQLTVSWCEFAATVAGQSAVQLGGSGETTTPRITLHHNWWSTNLASALPAATSGQVHQYSNYVAVTGNTTGTAVSGTAQLFSEGNVYSGTANPLAKSGSARIRALDNTYPACTGTTDSGADTVFTPSYSYTLLDRNDLATLLPAQAGNVSGAGYTEEAVPTASITATVVPGVSATLTASVIGATASGHQWRLNNAPISGATGSTYTISGMAAANAGTYTVAVSLANGDTVVSTPTAVSLGTAPTPTPTPTPSKGGGGGACGAFFALAVGSILALRRRVGRRS